MELGSVTLKRLGIGFFCFPIKHSTAILAHAGRVLYGMELGPGSVTLKRIGFFCFPIKHSTHTATVTLKRIGFFVFQLNTQHTRYAALLAHAE
jgi:hypothetical protein